MIALFLISASLAFSVLSLMPAKVAAYPTTTAEASATLGSNGWFIDNFVTVYLNSTPDADEIHFAIDGVPGATNFGQTANANVFGDGVHNVTYYAVDNDLGEQETEKYILVHIDTVAPSTNCVIYGTPGQSTWYVSDVNLSFSGNDGGGSGIDHFEYKVDDGGWQQIAAGNATLATDGNHQVQFYAVDVAGNMENYQDVWIDVDRTDPILDINLSSGQTFYERNLSIEIFQCVDFASGINQIQYSVDSQGIQMIGAMDPYIFLNDLDDGVHTLTITVRDNAGNEITQTYNIEISLDNDGGGNGGGGGNGPSQELIAKITYMSISGMLILLLVFGMAGFLLRDKF